MIIADTDWKTFEALTGFNDECNLLNLSSDFAIKFIMECEHIDVIIASRTIPDIEGIKKMAARKKTSVYITGSDIRHPLDRNEFCAIIEKEKDLRLLDSKSQKDAAGKNMVEKIFGKKNAVLKPCTKPEDLQENILPENEIGIKSLKNAAAGPKDRPKQNDSPLHLDKFVAIKQKIIVFLKAKGGVGSTLLSVYLASQLSNLKTLLIDLNFSEGGSDTGYYLELPKTPNMILFTDGYNRTSLSNSVLNIKNGFDLLQPPPTYELARKMDLQDIYSIVDVARKKYHLLIFDLPNHIDDICLGVIDLADLAIMVSDFSSGSIARLTDINKRFIYSDLEKILILNRNRNGNGRHFIKNGLKDFFGISEIVSLDENVHLAGRSDFKRFDFGQLKDFESFTGKVLKMLTCD